MKLMAMKKIKICPILIVFVVLITSMGRVHAFDIDVILITSGIVDEEFIGRKTLFEPGEWVCIYVRTKNHHEDYIGEIDIKNVLYDSFGQIIDKYSFDENNYLETSSHDEFKYFFHFLYYDYNSTTKCHIWWWYIKLPDDIPIGKYTVEVTICDRSENVPKTAELTLYVDYYKIDEFFKEAEICFKDGNYEGAKNHYESAKNRCEFFAGIDETDYCREKIEECNKYILATDYYIEGEKYLRKKEYSNATNSFREAWTLYEELGDKDLAEICDGQMERCKNYRLAKIYCWMADENLKEKEYLDTIDYFKEARALYGALGDEDLVEMCNEQITHIAEKYYLKGKKCLEKKDYSNAYDNFKEARALYEELGDEDLVKMCDNQQKKCNDYTVAKGCFGSGEEDVKEEKYKEAGDHFREARALYEELGDEAEVKKCDNLIRENTGISLFAKDFPKIPSVANLIIITWIFCAIIIFKEFRKDKKNKIFIFSSIISITSFIFFIDYYFPHFLPVALLLMTIMATALAIKVVLKKHKKKMYQNPYIAGNPIRSKEIFFGRKDVFEFIKNKLSATKNITIVLHGERRTGKTSVLYQIENGELGREFVPVYIDIQEMAKVNESEFFIKITEKVFESFKRNKIIDLESKIYFEINEIMRNYRAELNPYQVFNKFLDKIPDLLEEKYLILMFDEYEILDRKIENKHLSPDLIRYLRSQMQSREKFSFIFTGSKKLEELGGKHWSLMFNAATYKKISFLEKKDALDLMNIPVENQVHYTNEAVNKILRLTACHPYFLQLVLQNLIDHLHDIEKNDVGIQEVTHVVNYLLDNPSPHMIYIWQDSTDKQKVILSLLSEIIKSEKEYISITKGKEDLNIALDVESIKKPLKELFQKEILNCRENRYNFRIDLLRHWIKTEHPLFKTLEDIP